MTVSRRQVATIIGAALSILLLPAPAWADAGDLDPAFGFDGIASEFAGCGGSCTAPNDVTILADGRLVLVGVVNTESQDRFGIAGVGSMFSADGQFETYGFSPVGRSFLDATRAIAPLPDGGAVLGGWWMRCLDDLDPCGELSPMSFLVSRTLGDGGPDPAFGGDGTVKVRIGSGGGSANGVAVQTDGSVVASGPVANLDGRPRIAAVRFLPDGSLDPSFGHAGKVLLPGGQSTDVEIDAEGRVVLAGGTADGAMLVVRLLPDGTPDPTFGIDGRVTLPVGVNANDVLLLPGGRIVVGGWAEVPDGLGGTQSRFALARLLADGSLDPGFGGDGTVRTRFARGAAQIDELAVMDDGRLLAGGGLGVVRYDADGRRDPTFSRDGRAWFPWEIEGLVVQGDGLLVGINSWDYGMSIARISL